MENIEKFENIEKERLIKIADDLKRMQAEENGGMGVSCVRQIADYLRMGMLREARTFAETDADKIRNYPAIKEYIKKHLFTPENHPWHFEDNY